MYLKSNKICALLLNTLLEKKHMLALTSNYRKILATIFNFTETNIYAFGCVICLDEQSYENDPRCWSSGQHAHLLFQEYEFLCRWSLQFLYFLFNGCLFRETHRTFLYSHYSFPHLQTYAFWHFPQLLRSIIIRPRVSK